LARLLARRARRDLLEVDWSLIDAIEDAGSDCRNPSPLHFLRQRSPMIWGVRYS